MVGHGRSGHPDAVVIHGRQPPPAPGSSGPWLGFFAIGLLAATWAARLPAVQESLSLSAGGLAVALIGVEGGALVGLPVGSRLVARWGGRRCTSLGFLAYAVALAATAAAPSLGWLTVGVAVWASANSVLDVALNADAVELERRSGRPLLNRLHAAQGAGLLTGAVVATGAAALDVPLVLHVCAVSGLVLAAGLHASRAVVAGPPPARPPASRRPGRGLVLVGLVAFCAFLVDAAAMNWVAVHLRTEHDAAPAVAAAGYLVLMAGVVVGRLRADRLVERRSRSWVVRACGALVVAGVGGVVLAPTAGVAMVGWLLVGLGVAPLAPAVLAAAPDAARAGGPGAPAAIATVTAIGYLGSFSGPPVIGLLAGPVGLGAALLLVAVAGAAAAALAGTLPAGPG